ncbi:SAM-dependent methyltransferase [Rhodoferax koreense]|uniref:SAM-dependent methyltransferase n=1 Tax=Rhodoferax koreensis TaxID=1842727 RepID=A0A1P8JUE2_9BURK|nr:class I SAM-dependent methyltransferase [Rhodoferax koreense]APW37389.1 SAM-dependent methyltransferase [Rhodoferax koreense]
MSVPDNAPVFAGSVPQLYEKYMVPLIFEPYAVDMAARVAERRPSQVLEVAAGTGVVTRKLARLLPPEATIVATDLSPAMLEQAALAVTGRPITWRQADAMQLPFPDAAFDVVVCQFGVMFFPDKAQAFAEARRVLRPGGTLLFNVWDRIEDNEFADTVTTALAGVFPDDPPRFPVRVPHGYFAWPVIAQDLAAGGFTGSPAFATLAARSRADSPEVPALAYCQGTPLRGEIEARGHPGLADATAAAAEAIARRFGTGAVDGGIQASIVCVDR